MSGYAETFCQYEVLGRFKYPATKNKVVKMCVATGTLLVEIVGGSRLLAPSTPVKGPNCGT